MRIPVKERMYNGKIIKEVNLEGEAFGWLVLHIAEKFTKELEGKVLAPGDSITLTYTLKMNDDGEFFPVPTITWGKK